MKTILCAVLGLFLTLAAFAQLGPKQGKGGGSSSTTSTNLGGNALVQVTNIVNGQLVKSNAQWIATNGGVGFSNVLYAPKASGPTSDSAVEFGSTQDGTYFNIKANGYAINGSSVLQVANTIPIGLGLGQGDPDTWNYLLIDAGANEAVFTGTGNVFYVSLFLPTNDVNNGYVLTSYAPSGGQFSRVTNSPVTSTELGYLSGATSSLQTQLANKIGMQNGVGINLSVSNAFNQTNAAIGGGSLDNYHRMEDTNGLFRELYSFGDNKGATLYSWENDVDTNRWSVAYHGSGATPLWLGRNGNTSMGVAGKISTNNASVTNASWVNTAGSVTNYGGTYDVNGNPYLTGTVATVTGALIPIQSGSGNLNNFTNATLFGANSNGAVFLGSGNGAFIETNNASTTNFNLRPNGQAAGSGLTIGAGGNVGIGTVTPSNALQIVSDSSSIQSGPATTLATLIGHRYKKLTNDPASGDYIFSQASSLADAGRPRNEILYWGYNMTSGGGRDNALDTALGYGLEGCWNSGAAYTEAHFIYTDFTDTQHRLFSWRINKSNSLDITVYYTANNFSWNNYTNNQTFLYASPSQFTYTTESARQLGRSIQISDDGTEVAVTRMPSSMNQGDWSMTTNKGWRNVSFPGVTLNQDTINFTPDSSVQFKNNCLSSWRNSSDQPVIGANPRSSLNGPGFMLSTSAGLKWSTSATDWSSGAGSIMTNSAIGNLSLWPAGAGIGINVATPLEKLDVAGIAKANGFRGGQTNAAMTAGSFTNATLDQTIFFPNGSARTNFLSSALATNGTRITIKDWLKTASGTNIQVTATTGTVEGSTYPTIGYVINSDSAAVTFEYNGTNWFGVSKF